MTAALAQEAGPATPAPEHPPVPPGSEANTEVAEHGPEPFPPLNPDYFAAHFLWLVISFVAFYFLMKNVALPRIGGILEDRRDRVASDLDHAQRLKEQSDQAIAAYERALAEARARSYKIAEEAREKVVAATSAQRSATEAELANRLAAAERTIGEIKDRALSQVGDIATETAEAVVEALTGAAPARREIGEAVAAAMAGRERG